MNTKMLSSYELERLSPWEKLEYFAHAKKKDGYVVDYKRQHSRRRRVMTPEGACDRLVLYPAGLYIN